MVDALRRASARRINAVIPYFGYARQDRKDRPRVPISARLIADLLETAGVHRVITVDLHAGQIQGFFRIPLDHLMAFPVFVRHLKSMNLKNVVFVSPDAGGVDRAMALARKLGGGFAVLDKRREKPNVAEIIHVIGDVEGKTAFIVDDIVDTAGTLVKAAEALIKNGAEKVYAVATHGVLSGPALERISSSPIEKLIITDTINLKEKVEKCDKIEVLSISELLAEAIKRVHEERSITELFQ
jgi:ribose-phosphate pyrophosphokinase